MCFLKLLSFYIILCCSLYNIREMTKLKVLCLQKVKSTKPKVQLNRIAKIKQIFGQIKSCNASSGNMLEVIDKSS